MATICAHHVLASTHGIPAGVRNEQALMIRAGINPQPVIEHGRRVHTEQVARLFKLVQLELDDEFMGFTARPCRVGVFATMCELVSRCRTLGELLERGVSFYNLITDDVSIDIRVARSRVFFSFRLREPSLDVEHFLAEFLLVIWHRFSSWYIGEAIHLRETHFAFPPPAHRSELLIMFPGKLLFDEQANRLVFDVHYLDRPLVRSELELMQYLENAPADIMTIPGTDNSLEVRIERLIFQDGSESLDFPALEDLAERLELSAQALYRQLKQAGTSYQKIKDNIRRETAIKKLVRDGLSVEEVSEMVGFAEPRSFTRAFKTWTGLSPRKYIQSQRQKP